MGYLCLNYDEIVSIFGEPNYGPSGDSKTDWEWIFEINKNVITIYNYKTGPAYTRDRTIRPQDIDSWHIGGSDIIVLNLINKYISNVTGDKFSGRGDLVVMDRFI